MASPFIGEIRLFAGTFAPQGWQLCDGTLLDVGQNPNLFSLITNLYGGDGASTFAVPDLRGRVPMSVSVNHPLAQAGGEESVTLSEAAVGPHSHALMSSGQPGDTAKPTELTAIADENLASEKSVFIYAPSSQSLTIMSENSIGTDGGGDAHENRQPYVALTYIIALEGVMPPKPPPASH